MGKRRQTRGITLPRSHSGEGRGVVTLSPDGCADLLSLPAVQHAAAASNDTRCQTAEHLLRAWRCWKVVVIKAASASREQPGTRRHRRKRRFAAAHLEDTSLLAPSPLLIRVKDTRSHRGKDAARFGFLSVQIRPCRKERESSFLCAYIRVLLVTVARVHVRSRDLAITWQLKPKYSFSFSVSEHTGETEDEAEPKRTGKKESRKRDARTPAAAAAAPAPPPGSPVRGQRKGAQSFFAELRAELQGGPAAPPAGAGAAASRSRERVAVVRFCSRRRTGGQQPHPHGDTKTKASLLEKTKASLLEKDVDVQEFNLEKCQAQDTDIFKRKKRKGQEDRKSRKKQPAASMSSGGRNGQVGRFKNGTLILSQVDIKKINSSRVAR
ncbi:uncharacterized protein C1orf131 homolog [Pteropus vampyrus]|uniref:Uncharacterized protein C1orf131 homolog n=1 Tax=Pteropus vampyrus TaxID=132908 RepID=A0A6P6BWP7_PTEVA|nr:uncharacterized protein C1orf131 homolog [Pteropus vampyrus]